MAKRDAALLELFQFTHKAAEGYQKWFNEKLARWTGAALEVQGVASKVTGGDVADIGCGTGAFVDALRSKNMKVNSFAAVDKAHPMLEVLRTKVQQYEDFTATPPKVAEMDGLALDFPDASFDATFSIFVVSFYSDPDKGVAELFRVTKPGGVVVVVNWETVSWGTYFRQALVTVLPQTATGEPTVKKELFDTTEALDAVLKRNSGSSTIETSIDTVTHTFRVEAEEAEEMFRSMLAIAPVLSSIPEEDRSAVADKVVARCLEQVRHDTEGERFYNFPCSAHVAVAYKPAN